MNGPDNQGDKSRTDLIPPRALLEVGHAMKIGAGDYGERNWEAGITWGSLLGAAQRHQLAWLAGEDINPETDHSHLAHAAASLLMLLELVILERGDDDRRPSDDQDDSGTMWCGLDVATSEDVPRGHFKIGSQPDLAGPSLGELAKRFGLRLRSEMNYIGMDMAANWNERHRGLYLCVAASRERRLHNRFPIDEPLPDHLRQR